MRFAFALLAVLAISSAFAQVPSLNGSLVDLDDFFSGVWSYFNLSENAAQSCFSTQIQANSYFQLLGLDGQYMFDFSSGNRAAVLADVVSLEATLLIINNSLNCLSGTTDYVNLLNAAGFNTSNMTTLQTVQGLYYQAHVLDYAMLFLPIAQQIASTDYNGAGIAFGELYSNIALNCSFDDAYHLALQAWDNYVFFFYNISTPQELPQCYNDDNAQEMIAFFYLWSATVFNSTQNDVVANTNAFFQGVGGQLLQNTASVRYCEDQTQDQTRLNTAVGVDIHSQQFFDAIQTYIQNNVAIYETIFNEIYSNLAVQNVAGGAVAWAEFVNLVAASMNN